MAHSGSMPIIGNMKTLGLPIKSSGELNTIRMPAPWLGQHTDEVLQQLGYAPEQVEAMFAQGAVFDQYRARHQP